MTRNIDKAALDTMTVNDVARLPAGVLLDLQVELAADEALMKSRKAILFAAEDQRYGQSARERLAAEKREGGTVHIQDGDLVCHCEFKKNVKWDQAQLAALWTKIAMAGDDPLVYMKRELSVSEAVLKGWPETVRAEFEPARTVQLGKPVFEIRGPKE